MSVISVLLHKAKSAYPTTFDHKDLKRSLLLLITINTLKFFIDHLNGFCPIAFDHIIIYIAIASIGTFNVSQGNNRVVITLQ